MTSQEQFTKRCSLSLNIQKKKKKRRGVLYVSARLSGCMWTWTFRLAACKGFLKISRCKCQKWVNTAPGLGTTRTHQRSLEVSLWFWVARGRASCPECCWLQRNHSRSGWVWVRASVPLWTYWWHHKPLNQCFTTPGYSLVGFVAVVRFSKKKNTK